jgi:ATP-binding cassette subfamily C protein LapB
LKRNDVLLDCLVELTRIHGRPMTHSALIAGLPVDKGGLTPSTFSRAAAKAGFATKIQKMPFEDLGQELLPAVLLLNKNKACVLLSINKEKATASVLFSETGQGTIAIPINKLKTMFTGHIIFSRPRFRLDQRTPEISEVAGRHWFWSAFLEQKSLYKDVMVAAFLINLFALAVPFFSMNVYDRVIPTHAEETLWMLVIGVLLITGFDYILKLVRSHFVDLAGSRIDVKLSGFIMQKVMGMRLADKPASVGSFAQTLRSFEAIRDFVSSASVTALIDLPFAILFIIVIAWIAWPLIILPLIAVVFVLLYTFKIQKEVHALTEQSQRTAALRNSVLIESLSALETLKTLGAENYIQTKWEMIAAQLAKVSSSTRLKSHSATGVVGAMSAVCVALNVLVGVYLIHFKMLTMGGLIASGMLIGRIIAPLGQVVSLMMQYENAKLSLKTIEEQMKKPTERSQDISYVHREHIRGDIELRQVKFSYPNQENKALDGVSINIKQGEHVAIIGRTGSGKTTLVRLILGLYQPSEGAIRLDGIDLRQIDPADVRSHMGSVEQHTTLFFGSLRENITIAAPHVEDSQIIEAAEIGMLTDMVNQHPRGFDMTIGERGESLSGGQRQGVAIARAVLMSPSILLFDEPTSAMDFTTETLFIKKMKSYTEGKTLIVTTHRMSLLDLVDRLIVMDQGKIVADGPKAEVLKAISAGKVKVGT